MTQARTDDPRALVEQMAARLNLTVSPQDAEQAAALVAGMAAMMAGLRQAMAHEEASDGR